MGVIRPRGMDLNRIRRAAAQKETSLGAMSPGSSWFRLYASAAAGQTDNTKRRSVDKSQAPRYLRRRWQLARILTLIAHFQSVLVETHSFQQLDEARVRAHRVVERFDLEPDQLRRPLLVSLTEPFKSPILVAKSEVNDRYRGWRGVRPARQLVDQFYSLVAPARGRIRVPEVGD